MAESGEGLRKAVSGMASDFRALQEAINSHEGRELIVLERTEQVLRNAEGHIHELQRIEDEIARQASQVTLAYVAVGTKVEGILVPMRDNITEAIRNTYGQLVRNQVEALLSVIEQLQQASHMTLDLLGQMAGGQQGLVAAAGDLASRAETVSERSKEFDGVFERAESLTSTLTRLSEGLSQMMHIGIGPEAESDGSPTVRQGEKETATERAPTAEVAEANVFPVVAVSASPVSPSPAKSADHLPGATSTAYPIARAGTVVSKPKLRQVLLKPKEPIVRVDPKSKGIWAGIKRVLGLGR